MKFSKYCGYCNKMACDCPMTVTATSTVSVTDEIMKTHEYKDELIKMMKEEMVSMQTIILAQEQKLAKATDQLEEMAAAIQYTQGELERNNTHLKVIYNDARTTLAEIGGNDER